MESRPAQQIPHGVLDCLELFEYAATPEDIIDVYDQRRMAATTGDNEAINKFRDIMSALALYPEDCTTDPWPATNLFMTFARSSNPTHVEQAIWLLPQLWEVDQDGARRIAEECMLRPSVTDREKSVHATLDKVLQKSYLMGRIIMGNQTEDGVVLLSAERLRRRSQQAS